MKTYKNYAYLVSEGGSGVQIVDLSGLPDTAVLVKNFIYVSTTPPDSGKSIDRSHTVTIADGYLYCNGSAHWSPAGSVIFSLRTDPTNPEYMGEYEPTYIHDSYARNDTFFGLRFILVVDCLLPMCTTNQILFKLQKSPIPGAEHITRGHRSTGNTFLPVMRSAPRSTI